MTSVQTYSRGPLDIVQIPILEDNYIYLVVQGQNALVVDPGLAAPVFQYVETHDLKIKAILNTHHHWDHTDGNLEIQKTWDCPIYGSAYDRDRIPGQTHSLKHGETLEILGLDFQIIETPGHTLGHIAYWNARHNFILVGDTLFSLGCGRLFEGSPEQMWTSLQKLAALPAETLAICTHEYTEDNLRFQNSVFPNDPTIMERSKNIRELRAKNKPTVPMTMAIETQTNLFLRANDPDIKAHLNMKDEDPWKVFGKIRELKDSF